MQEGRHGANAITVGTTEVLLTSVGSGAAVHLTPCAAAGRSGRPAVPLHLFEPPEASLRPGLANYDRDALTAPRWATTTMCGRAWAEMVGGEGGSLAPRGEDPGPALIPTCGACLSVLDRMFPPPVPHPGLPVVARVVADAVAEHGRAEVHGVPGDQQTELRRQIRSLVRKRTGLPCQTLVFESTVFAVCDPILDSHRDEIVAAAAEAMQTVASCEAPWPRPEPEWCVSWSTWASD